MGYGYLYRTLSKAMQPPKTATNKTQVYIAIDGQQSGPFTKTELTQLVKKGVLTAQTWVWEAGMTDWAPAANLPHINKLLLLNAPKPKAAKTETTKTSTAKASAAKTTPQAEHPIRADLIGALAQLGSKGPAVTKSVNKLLADQPDISSSAALKILLQQQQGHR